MHLFYCPELVHDVVELPEEEAHHATHVLRLGAGERIGLIDGKGTRATAVLASVSKKSCMASITERVLEPQEPTAGIWLAVAPTKQSDRMEWLVEKAVEIGVGRITPLLTARTERQRLRTDRLQRVAIAAMKQSQRAWLPRIDELTALDRLLDAPLPPQRFFGWCMEDPAPLMTTYSPQGDALLLIGPEGDFDSGEAERLKQHGFAPVGLGAARLRTETAALAAVAWMSLARQR